jgi:hypothetical protein
MFLNEYKKMKKNKKKGGREKTKCGRELDRMGLSIGFRDQLHYLL